jgi:radical SAM enzyme (rSAM/lipoprotein system)
MNKKPTVRKRIALELFRRLRKNQVILHEMHTLFWECTLRCNLACLHCGSDCRVSSDSSDMPLEDFLKVIDELTPYVNPNKVLIIFTGGEALLRKDIEQCGSELYRRGYPWGIVSNGMAFDKRLDGLLAAGMRSATISLDGFEKAHNRLRGHPQSYEKAVRSVQGLIRTTGVVWDVVTCANQWNFDDLPEFKRFLIDLGVKKWRIFTIFPAGRAVRIPELQLDDDQFTRLMDFIRDCRREGIIHTSYGCEGFLGNYEMEVRDHFFKCNAGVHVASVLADGSISACPSIRSNFHQGNIYTDRLIDVWNNRFQPFRDRSWARKGQCADCAMFRYCEGSGMHLYDDRGELMFCHYKRFR